MRFNAVELAKIIGGQLRGQDVVIESVSIDSRSMGRGGLFVPIVAERDGHSFIPDAVSNGAICYLSSQDEPAQYGDASVILVDDTMAALTRVGREARTRLPDPVIGITGSVGKTSVKDLVAAACGASVATHANRASFNNELGLPLTLANAPEGTKITVLEMGARGQGHITGLSAIGRPTIGVVTRVGAAHTELFGSLQSVALAKGELIEALPDHGVAVLNADDPLVLSISKRAPCPVVTFGAKSGDFGATDIRLDEQLRVRFVLQFPSGSRPVSLQVSGRHMATNAVAALATASAAGVGIDEAIRGIEQATICGLRMEVIRRSDGLVVINDCYNANPTSMAAAFDALEALSVTARVAVVGVMAELGPGGDREHRDLASRASDSGIHLIAVGAPAYGALAIHVGDVAEARSLVEGFLGPDVGLLVKGSRVAELERLSQWLLDEPEPEPE